MNEGPGIVFRDYDDGGWLAVCEFWTECLWWGRSAFASDAAGLAAEHMRTHEPQPAGGAR